MSTKYCVWRRQSHQAWRKRRMKTVPKMGDFAMTDLEQIDANAMVHRLNEERKVKAIKIKTAMVRRDNWQGIYKRLASFMCNQWVKPEGVRLSDLYQAIRNSERRSYLWMTLNDLFETCRSYRCVIEGMSGPSWSYEPNGSEIVKPPEKGWGKR